jgi:hypothetical protein
VTLNCDGFATCSGEVIGSDAKRAVLTGGGWPPQPGVAEGTGASGVNRKPRGAVQAALSSRASIAIQGTAEYASDLTEAVEGSQAPIQAQGCVAKRCQAHGEAIAGVGRATAKAPQRRHAGSIRHLDLAPGLQAAGANRTIAQPFPGRSFRRLELGYLGLVAVDEAGAPGGEASEHLRILAPGKGRSPHRRDH